MTIEELCRRVYAGRAQLRRVAIDPDPSTIAVVVSHEDWCDLIDEHRRAVNGLRALAVVYPDGRPRYKIFDLDINPAMDITPGEIRFRSEVVL